MKSNKKQIISILAILTMAILLSCAFVACDKVDTDKTGTDIVADYKVTIHPNNGQGDIVWDITKEIPTITKDGFHIAGYFLDAQLTISTTLESLKATGITKNIDVYVKWEEDVCEHVEVTDVAVAPTCTEKGLTEGKHCSKCGKILKAQTEIDALGHDLENHDGQEATCTEKGWKAYVTCKREGCGYTTYQEIPALGHTEVVDDAIAPTCTEKGKTEGKHCSVCNTIIVAQTDIAALGHDLEHHNKKDATCTEPGWEAYDTCKRDGCTYTTYKAIAATGHTPSDWVVDVAATCEKDGSVYKECTVCHVELERDTTSKLGHDLEHHVGKPATCTEKGWDEYDTCKREGCGYTTYQEIPALGHKYSQEWSTDKTYHWHASTCGHDVVSDKGEHTFDSNWVCTECAYVDTGLHGVELRTNTLELDGTDIFGKVSNATSTFSFINEIAIADSAKYTVSTDINGLNVIPTKTVSLSIGDNTFYILVENGKELGLYTVVIRRRPMYNVSFNVNGGTSVSSQTIEEDHFATEPTTERKGYTFDKWDYDFSKPIIKDTTITASWNIITYNVYYDLSVPSDSISQDVDNSMNVSTYTVEDAITFQTPSRKGYRFTGWDKNIEKGTIGDVTVTASWEVIEYDIVYDFGDADSVSKATNNTQNPSKYTIENTITFAEPSRGYYTFSAWNIDKIVPGTTETQTIVASWIAEQHTINYVLSNGWTNSENNITAYTIEDKTITLYDAIKGESLFCGWYLDEECKNYIATIDASTMRDYTVYAYADDSATKGLSFENERVKGYSGTSATVVIPSYYKGNSVTSIGEYAFYGCTGLTSITIPDSVTSIGYSAFRGCKGLTNITLPFVGASKTASNGYDQVFGYIFGYDTTSSSSSAISGATYQYYGNSKYYHYYIPSSITSVTITGRTIPYRAFYNCSGLTSVTIGNGVTSVGESAFSGCTGLMSVTIGNSVTSIGDWAFSGCTGLMSVTIGNSVTSIGYSAFYGCTGLSSIIVDKVNTKYHSAGNCLIETATKTLISGCKTSIIPSDGSVTSVGSDAFRGCTGLTSITIPNSVTSIGNSAFSGCSGLSSVTIPDSVTSIGGGAFHDCTGLTSVTIPDGVMSIGEYAFWRCEGLSSVTIGNGVTSIGGSAFESCTGLTSVTIGNSVTRIGERAFDCCTNLTSITIPDSVTSIYNRAFDGCSNLQDIYITDVAAWCNISGLYDLMEYGASNKNLYINNELATSITIPNGVIAIPSCAFRYCTGLASVTIPDSVTSIGRVAFSGCTGLTSITIPNSVTSIGEDAFQGCRKLQDIYITDISAWCNISGLYYLMDYGSSNKNLYINNELATSITIPNGVTAIPSYAFLYYTSLTSVTIPDSVTSIGSWAFKGCSGLESINVAKGNTKYHSSGNCLIETASKTLILGCKTSVIPSDGSVTSIGDYAFGGCTGLTNITIPDSVTRIGEYAFEGCTGLTSIEIPDSVTSIGGSAFESCTGFTSVTIGNSVTSIGRSAFKGCADLTTVNWNATECTSAGSDNYPIFYGCSNLTTVNIGDNVTTIPSDAFRGCKGLTSVTIPDSVTSIGSDAFRGCTSLTSITIGNGVTYIGHEAFCFCTSLTGIAFNGTIAQWNAISKGIDWKYNVPSACKVICKDGTVSI